jgi:hypothetical protein
MTHAEFVTRRIDAALDAGNRIPIDLFMEAVSIGLDVDAIERKHAQQQGDK